MLAGVHLMKCIIQYLPPAGPKRIELARPAIFRKCHKSVMIQSLFWAIIVLEDFDHFIMYYVEAIDLLPNRTTTIIDSQLCGLYLAGIHNY